MGRLKTKDLKDDNLKGTQWIGIVEDNADDIFEGRCKVRVFGKMDQRVDPEDPQSAYLMPTESLPWARPSVASSGGSNTGSGTFSFPKIGTVLRVSFDNGNYYAPVYHESLYPSDETKAEIEASYPNSHVLIYDTAFGLSGDLQSGNPEVTNEREGEHIKVFFTEEKGLMIDYTTTEGPTTVNVLPDNSVRIINANGDSMVMLNDGNITFTHSAQFTINSGADTVINATTDTLINCVNAVITATGSTHLNSPKITLGEQGTDAVLKGTQFINDLYNNHTHIGNHGAPTSPPMAVGNPALSTKNTTD